MRHLVLPLALLVALLSACKVSPDYDRELPPGSQALIPIERDDYPSMGQQWSEREDILPALDRSIDWTRREHSKQFFPVDGISHERALASLIRFREVLEESYGADDLQERLVEEFQVYVSAGWDGHGGGVLFTGYHTPLLEGSLERSNEYCYPLYALPPDLLKNRDGSVAGWQTAKGILPSYPSRRAIEAGAMLEGRGLELVWLRDPIDAYIAHVNGSAFVRLPTGEMYRLGYAGKNGRSYVSLGRELEEDGVLPKGGVSLRSIREWAATTPDEAVVEYLYRNPSYVFFTPIDGNPHGSLDVEVQGRRSIATDKTLFPRGAVVFVEAEVPSSVGGYGVPFERFMLDQDTGGAIRTAGRGDLYFGIGDEAEAVAGATRAEGQLYYLFLREDSLGTP